MAEDTDPELTMATSPTVERPTAACVGSCLVQIYPVGPVIGARCVLGEEPVTIGREGGCDLRVSDRSVSRFHARIEREGDGYQVIDLQSTNGTFVNGTPVRARRLSDGDTLRTGDAVFRFLAPDNLEAAYHEEIHRLAVIDPLTGAHNQRYLLEGLDRELHRSLRYRRPLALLLFDVDCFKAVNDALGHLAGDAALCELTACVREVLRKEALFARYGGEEFAVLLPETTVEDAVRVAERIRGRVQEHVFCFEGHRFRLTVSVGVASVLADEKMTPQELIRLADLGLYQAKGAGRNRVWAPETPPAAPPALPEGVASAEGLAAPAAPAP